MDTSNWRPTQGVSGAVDPSVECGNWRDQLQADSRQKIVNKMYVLVVFLLVTFLFVLEEFDYADLLECQLLDVIGSLHSSNL